jgi:pSer/pThr/pTyr-binding forkhead associated (FHA) protein
MPSTFDSPMLFLPPRAPVPVPAEGSIVIGRSRQCDLRLAHSDASRRHAEIYKSPDGYTLRDLDSTNGTYVNGHAVREHQLEPGDRIGIAGSEITFCVIAPELEPGATGIFSDEKTVLSERPVPVEVFRGDLTEIPPFAILQTLELGSKTGVVLFDAAGGFGEIWLERGQPVHAETKSQKGFDAALSLVASVAGRFSFEPDRTPPEKTITANVTELLLEASRIEDEELR